MSVFLQIIGGLCVGGVLVAVVGFLIMRMVLKRKFSGLMNEIMDDMSDGVTSTPLQIEVRPELISWANAAAVDADSDVLTSSGFVRIEDYRIHDVFYRQATSVALRAFYHPEWNAYAVLYEMAGKLTWADIWQSFNETEKLTLTSAPEGEAVSTMPGRTKIYRKGVSVSELIEEFPSLRPDRVAEPCPPHSFASLFSQEYNAFMDWRAVQGGPTTEEVRRIALASGMDTDDESIELARSVAAAESQALLRERLKEAFLDSGQISARAWDEVNDEYFIIHDRMDNAALTSQIQAISYSGLPEEIMITPDGLPPRERFKLICERTDQVAEHTLLGSVETPVPADFFSYRFDPSKWPDDDDDEDDE